MFHLVGWYNSALGTVADTDINAISDDVVAIQNNHFIVGNNWRMIAAYAGSATLIRAKFETPSMRQIAGPFIRPPNVNLLPPTNSNADIFEDNPFPLIAGEELQMKATANPGTTEPFFGLAWIEMMGRQMPSGPITALRLTSTTAAVAGAWTTLTSTFADTIPSGTYAAVLSEHYSTNAIAHRWIASNHFYRPGYLSGASSGIRLPDGMGKSQFGQMFTFKSNDLPRLQVLCNAADAAHTAFLHVQKIGSLAA